MHTTAEVVYITGAVVYNTGAVVYTTGAIVHIIGAVECCTLLVQPGLITTRVTRSQKLGVLKLFHFSLTSYMPCFVGL